MYDVAIVGGGPAGLGAAIAASTEGLNALVLEASHWGGQSAGSPLVENFPGFSHGITGAELAFIMQKQAKRLGADMVLARVDGLWRVPGESTMALRATTQDEQHIHVQTRAVIVASGLHYRRLGDKGTLPMHYLGTQDVDVREKCCLVVGAGNGAAQTALDLAQHADKVFLLCRGDHIELSMSAYLVDRVRASNKIIVLTKAELLSTDDRCANVQCAEFGQICIPCSDGFVFIGAEPASEWLGGLVERDAAGYVAARLASTKGGLALPYGTTAPGIFIAGDLRQGSMKRIVVAAAEGTQCVPLVMNYLHMENA